MIPWSWVRLSPIKGGYVGVEFNFEPKMGLGARPDALHTTLSTQTSFIFGVPS